ncbi:MAG: hypothetical protein EBR09_01045 [Proteobacteria bacterium]|nr:hypothetical protein [Pseudomonadota bacterium]
MRSKTKKLNVSGKWKSQRKNSVLAGWLLLAAGLIILLVVFSMGSRNPDTQNSPSNRFNSVRNSIRGFEPPLDPLTTEDEQKEDTRTHADFHFRWHRKYSPPDWKLTASKKKDRQDTINRLLKLGKSNLMFSRRNENSDVFQVKEYLSKGSEAYILKNALPLLPGERLQISSSGSSQNAKQWKMRVRSTGATQDRLDAPLILTSGFEESAAQPLEIDPRGSAKDIELPQAAEFAKHASKPFYVEWPESASGILLVEGFSAKVSDPAKETNPHLSVIVHIDELSRPLTSLTRTMNALKNASPEGRTTLHLTQLIPPSRNKALNLKSMRTLKNPVELGATLKNPKLKSFLQPEPLLLNKSYERGGSLRMLNISAGTEQCKTSCSDTADSDLNPEEYSAIVSVRRKDEFSSAAGLFRTNAFLVDGGLLLADLNFPAGSLRLNWDSSLENGQSALRWLTGGLSSVLGLENNELKSQEKLFQTDILLSALVEKILASDTDTSIAIILNDNSDAAKQSAPHSVARIDGEALLSMSHFNVTAEKPAFPLQINSKISLISAIKLFDRINISKERTTTVQALTEAIEAENLVVSQLSDGTVTTESSAGWIADHLPGPSESLLRTVFSAPPDQIYNIQEKSNAERRRWRLHGLNILLPNNNEKDELVSISVAGNLKPVGCESESENAQSDSRAEDATRTDEKNLNTLRIVGRRTAKTQWHLHCVLEGRITTASRLKIVTRLNNMPVPRERIGLGEFSLPVRGFLWRSPETLELTGAQILDATASVNPAEKDAVRQSSVVIWTDTLLTGLNNARMTFSWSNQQQGTPASVKIPAAGNDRLSEK